MAVDSELTKYVCLFHHKDHAQAALQDLEKAGINRSAITMLGNDAPGDAAELESLGVPRRDVDRLAKGISQGGVVLSLSAAEDQGSAIESIFHKHTAEKIDEQAAQAAYVAPVAAVPVAAAATEGEVIALVEEELVVGKREVDRGGVRVFQRVVEEPVTDSVQLREEHVVVERHPVDRAVTQSDLLAGDQVLELTETAEQAVVGKVARVVEEVRVGKQSSEHTETIRDTVRHTEVEVEEVPAEETLRPRS